MGYQSKTYSLSDEVIAWLGTLKDDYGSVNKGLLAMIVLCNGGPPRIAERLTSSPISETEARIISQEQEILRESSPLDNRPKNAYCKHCGSRFAGPKFSTICSECKGSGHTLTPAECPRCTEAQAI